MPSTVEGERLAFWVNGAEVPCGFAEVLSGDITELGDSVPECLRNFSPGQYVQVHNLTLAERPNRKRVAKAKDPSVVTMCSRSGIFDGARRPSHCRLRRRDAADFSSSHRITATSVYLARILVCCSLSKGVYFYLRLNVLLLSEVT